MAHAKYRVAGSASEMIPLLGSRGGPSAGNVTVEVCGSGIRRVLVKRARPPGLRTLQDGGQEASGPLASCLDAAWLMRGHQTLRLHDPPRTCLCPVYFPILEYGFVNGRLDGLSTPIYNRRRESAAM